MNNTERKILENTDRFLIEQFNDKIIMTDKVACSIRGQLKIEVTNVDLFLLDYTNTLITYNRGSDNTLNDHLFVLFNKHFFEVQ